MKIIKTPLDRFSGLPGYSFQANYVNVGNDDSSLMMHYVDYGEPTAPIVLMLHGEPTWSYLYRNIICQLEAVGFRVIAPDLIGFGKSDKFDSQDAYTYANHLDWLERFMDALALQDIALICQDWGGLLGLRLVANTPQRFAAVMAANTMLPTGDKPPPDAFLKWQAFSQKPGPFVVSKVIQNATVNEMIPEVLAAYDAPFPSEAHKCGVRKFPMLVPSTPDNVESENNRQAWKVLATFDKPFVTAFSDADPITAGGDKYFQKMIPGCNGQAHVEIKGGGHFLQEDAGEQMAQCAIRCFSKVFKKQLAGA